MSKQSSIFPLPQAYFSVDFLQKLRGEMTCKVRPSKSVLQALKHANQLNKQYKNEISQLKLKVEELMNDKQSNQGQQMQQVSGGSLLWESKVIERGNKKNIDSKVFSLSIQGEEQNDVQGQILKQKIQHLQQLLLTKERRYLQLVQRQAQLSGQIDILKSRNQNLSSKVSTLQSLLHSTAPATLVHAPQAKTHREAALSQPNPAQDPFNLYLKPKSSYQYQRYHTEQARHQQLQVSCTRTLQIHESYDIEKKAILRGVEEAEEYNQIDKIFDEVYNFSILSEMNFKEEQTAQPRVNLNNSIVDINTNEPHSI